MQRLLFWLFALSIALLFLFGTELLELLGWQFTADTGPFLTKIHPASYVLIPALLVAIVVRPYAVLNRASNPAFLIFLGATVILLIRAVYMIVQGSGGGEVGAIVVNFITPAMVLLVMAALKVEDMSRFAVPLRVFFAVNSMIALGERAVNHRLLPNFLDITTDNRSVALTHHPLEGAQLTGLMLVYLVTARQGQKVGPLQIGELALHGAAMFAFGGRSALVMTPIMMILSAVFARQRAGQVRATPFQRAMPFIIVGLGIGLIFLPIDFIDATIDRFSNDFNSAHQRDSAWRMLGNMSTDQLLFGIDIIQRKILMHFYQASAIELAWVAMVVAYGLLATLPMMIALPLLIFTQARRLDRSAFYMGLHFVIVTAGSLAFGVKTLSVVQFFVMTAVLCQVRGPAVGFGDLFRRQSAIDESDTAPAVGGRL